MGYNLFILDWDDTIFPTSHLTRGEFRTFTEKDIYDNIDLIFDEIDHKACALLYTMADFGIISIVTNASESWFKKSLKYFRMLSYAIETCRVSVFTADSAKNAIKMKESAAQEAKIINFDNALDLHFTAKNIPEKTIVNLISIGDQDAESEAAFRMCTKYSYIRAKCLKLRPFPAVNIIEYQLQWIRDRLKSISTLDKKFEVIEVFVDNVPNLKGPD